MTALPDQPQGRLPAVATGLLTVAQYAALGETEDGYTELVEGRLIMSPSPLVDHNVAGFNLGMQLAGQLPDDLLLIPDMDVDLELVPPDQPGFVRRPDLIVAQRSARKRQNTEGGLIKASEVVLVVEILSPSSRRTDYRAKRDEYADAGIPFYWIIDLDEPVSLAPLHLAGDFGYQEAPAETGTYEAVEPFPLKVQVDRLTD
ncbi:Endonuclease, Uma2 family (restriction endonuclease fold) [Lentzea xinjiangensis]|uniref:Endonuclease, Uma2 family (Restriction endonuclease fold) n=1 Tax=Lentzea xinjiangensis TaxID=402600 RepID=A0A1H9EI86_9PSEU|nr:Uma2 family endonuclease [Lentzea xinjiangensis]SEQ25450.1 Endonuclease, Uma2 family (restriction endonuclease fold) [Lentzea xinjiangensis]